MLTVCPPCFDLVTETARAELRVRHVGGATVATVARCLGPASPLFLHGPIIRIMTNPLNKDSLI